MLLNVFFRALGTNPSLYPAWSIIILSPENILVPMNKLILFIIWRRDWEWNNAMQ